MNQLIDTLLNFSRLAHAELHREPFDLSAMAHEIAAELEQAEPARRVTFRIAEGIPVDGDAKLVRVVMENLLGNAWKYTGAREEAVIEFGMADFDGKPAFFVRDNGPGFTMADAEKLFIPFQRLPGSDEFKGHGIGLATVERIIRRHGGRVWAEGEPGKGATFYFTLGSP
jgi:signal transduction histidine kinase